MGEKLSQIIDEAVRAIETLRTPQNMTFIEEAAHTIASCFAQGHKIILAGNGGSLCDANHIAEEFTGQFRLKRAALPALCLSEAGHLTCVANDFGFEQVFARGIEAFGREGDVFIGLTTSGRSPNMIAAFNEAKKRGLKTIAFLGKEGGQIKGVADLELIISGFSTSDRIQEAHMAAAHIIIERVEELLFDPSKGILNDILASVSRKN